MDRTIPNLQSLSGKEKRRSIQHTAFRLALLVLAAGLTAAAQASSDFNVDFHDCSEFAGEGPVLLANAAPLVPNGFTIAGAESGTANVVIRATSCGSVEVDGRHPQPTKISQIGINIVSPNGTGDINNYTIVYVSDNPFLVAGFVAAGLPAHYDPRLTYQYSAPSNANGNLYVTAGAPDLTPYFIYGPETAPPPDSAEPFLANWWYAPHGNAKMLQQTLLPDISFGTSSVTFYTSSTSVLGKLIGGNTFSNFSVLALRGVYPSGHMDVTTSR